MRDRKRLIGLARRAHPFRPVGHGDVAPVEVAFLQALPVFPRLGFPDGEQLPQGGHAQDDAVVDPVRPGLVAFLDDALDGAGKSPISSRSCEVWSISRPLSSAARPSGQRPAQVLDAGAGC